MFLRREGERERERERENTGMLRNKVSVSANTAHMSECVCVIERKKWIKTERYTLSES